MKRKVYDAAFDYFVYLYHDSAIVILATKK